MNIIKDIILNTSSGINFLNNCCARLKKPILRIILNKYLEELF